MGFITGSQSHSQVKSATVSAHVLGFDIFCLPHSVTDSINLTYPAYVRADNIDKHVYAIPFESLG